MANIFELMHYSHAAFLFASILFIGGATFAVWGWLGSFAASLVCLSFVALCSYYLVFIERMTSLLNLLISFSNHLNKKSAIQTIDAGERASEIFRRVCQCAFCH